MAVFQKAVPDPSSSGAEWQRDGFAKSIDRWIYVFMAAFLMAVTLAGFVPDSLMRIDRVRAGALPPFPALLHVHAALMGAWLTLLLAQTTLMATGRRTAHRQLGMASLVLAPLIVVVGFMLVPTINHLAWDFLHRSPAVDPAEVRATLARQAGNGLLQLRAGIGFSLFVALAIWARRRNSGLHKRMMILATTMPMTAAINRIAWLPTSRPESPISLELFGLMLVVPMLAWDLFRTKRLHRAYAIFFAVNLVLSALIHLLWNSPVAIRALSWSMRY